MSGEFQAWCQERGISHLTGAPYHPATNGAAERLVQTFKRALKKLSSPPRQALQGFLMQYRRTPLASGYSPSELLNGRQSGRRSIHYCHLPHIPHKDSRHDKQRKSQTVSNVVKQYTVGTPCYALYCGPRRDKDPRWVPATVTKVHDSRSVNVRVHPREAIW